MSDPNLSKEIWPDISFAIGEDGSVAAAVTPGVVFILTQYGEAG
jgi:hypothetical protein